MNTPNYVNVTIGFYKLLLSFVILAMGFNNSYFRDMQQIYDVAIYVVIG